MLPIHPGRLEIGIDIRADITSPAIKPNMPAASVKPDMLLVEFIFKLLTPYFIHLELFGQTILIICESISIF